MIDFDNIEKYRENNRIEAKKALGGLPDSVWETYSAFANSFGGVILLGVAEYDDKSLHPVNLPDPEDMVEEFRSILNDPGKVSVNILSDRNISIHESDGKRFISIEVPRAGRSDRPVYIDGNPMTGTYRRNGEGDYRCTRAEVIAMTRDISVKTQDMLVLEEMGFDVFDYSSIQRYRTMMKKSRPGHLWEELDDADFLYKLGAVGKGRDGKMHPTAAGLLMFGYEYEIIKEYPYYFLDYQEQSCSDGIRTFRIASSSGDWSGNIYDFYLRVYDRIYQSMNIRSGSEVKPCAAVHKALCEALANCLVNADYYGRQGIVVINSGDSFCFSNPGGFRIDVEAAKNGGISDPRNSALIRMFNMADISERTGSGIPNIFNEWKKQGWSAPEINESFEPERITLILKMKKCTEREAEQDTADFSEKSKTALYRETIISYLTENIYAQDSELSSLMGISVSHIRAILSEMLSNGIITAEDPGGERVYKLKI